MQVLKIFPLNARGVTILNNRTGIIIQDKNRNPYFTISGIPPFVGISGNLKTDCVLLEGTTSYGNDTIPLTAGCHAASTTVSNATLILPDGSPGQRLLVVFDVDGGGNIIIDAVGIINGTNNNRWQLSNGGESVEFVFTSTGWFNLGGEGGQDPDI